MRRTARSARVSRLSVSYDYDYMQLKIEQRQQQRSPKSSQAAERTRRRLGNTSTRPYLRLVCRLVHPAAER